MPGATLCMEAMQEDKTQHMSPEGLPTAERGEWTIQKDVYVPSAMQRAGMRNCGSEEKLAQDIGQDHPHQKLQFEKGAARKSPVWPGSGISAGNTA